jgi:hypothetical protein
MGLFGLVAAPGVALDRRVVCAVAAHHDRHSPCLSNLSISSIQQASGSRPPDRIDGFVVPAPTKTEEGLSSHRSGCQCDPIAPPGSNRPRAMLRQEGPLRQFRSLPSPGFDRGFGALRLREAIGRYYRAAICAGSERRFMP